MRKILKLIPNNEMFFHDCMYNLLFSVLDYYKKDFWGVINNEEIIYSVRNAACFSLSVDYVPQKSLREILATLGVGCKNIDIKEFISNICNEIDNGNPVLLRVDCFAEKIRRDLFGLRHLEHFVLVVGYDYQNELFMVIEHTSENALNYQMQEIKFVDLLAAHIEWKNFFGNDIFGLEFVAFYLFHGVKDNKEKKNSLRIISQESILGKNIEKLYFFVDNLVAYLGQKKYTKEIISEALESISKLILARDVLFRRVSVICVDELTTEIISKSIDDLKYVRMTLLAILYDGKEIEERVRTSITRLLEIHVDDERLCSQVFFLCKREEKNIES